MLLRVSHCRLSTHLGGSFSQSRILVTVGSSVGCGANNIFNHKEGRRQRRCFSDLVAIDNVTAGKQCEGRVVGDVRVVGTYKDMMGREDGGEMGGSRQQQSTMLVTMKRKAEEGFLLAAHTARSS